MPRRALASTTRMGRLAALLATLALVAAACSSGSGGGGSNAAEGSGSAGGNPGEVEETNDLPTQEFELSGGETATLDQFLGKPLVVNFFASWCAPCRAEMPDFEEVHQAVNDDVTFLGFDLQDTRADGEELVEETGVTYEWALDPRGDIYRSFEGFAMPTTLWVSAEGEILDRDNGAINAKTIRDRIAEHFGIEVS